MDAWLEVGGRDPVLGRLQQQFIGLRPVLFHSPYEAAVWSVLSARRHRAQATTTRQRLAERYGQSFELDGELSAAVPTPRQMLGVTELQGVESRRIEQLHAVAAAALAGNLDPGRLLSVTAEEAMGELQSLPGIGPTYATLILLRSTGATDILTTNEPRAASYMAHYYGLKEKPGPDQVAALAEHWKPFRTWALVLIRVAGDRDMLPWEPPVTSRRR